MFSIWISKFVFEYFESAGVKDSNYEYFQINSFESIHIFKAHLFNLLESLREMVMADSATLVEMLPANSKVCMNPGESTIVELKRESHCYEFFGKIKIPIDESSTSSQPARITR